MSRFDEAVRRWAGSTPAGPGPSLSADDYLLIRQGLLDFLVRPDADLDDVDRQEAADEAIARMAYAIAEGRVDTGKSPAGYLLVIARHVLVDRYRESGRAAVVRGRLGAENGDDAVVRLLDRLTTVDQVRAALRRAARRRDTTTVTVITTWLNLAAQHGRGPTSREVSAQVGVSKTAVAYALERFRGDLDRVREKEQ